MTSRFFKPDGATTTLYDLLHKEFEDKKSAIVCFVFTPGEPTEVLEILPGLGLVVTVFGVSMQKPRIRCAVGTGPAEVDI